MQTFLLHWGNEAWRWKEKNHSNNFQSIDRPKKIFSTSFKLCSDTVETVWAWKNVIQLRPFHGAENVVFWGKTQKDSTSWLWQIRKCTFIQVCNTRLFWQREHSLWLCISHVVNTWLVNFSGSKCELLISALFLLALDAAAEDTKRLNEDWGQSKAFVGHQLDVSSQDRWRPRWQR